MNGGGLLSDDFGRIGELLCGLEFAFGMNDFGAPLAFRLGLLGIADNKTKDE